MLFNDRFREVSIEGGGGVDWENATENLLTSGTIKSSGSTGNVLIGDALASRGSWSATPLNGAALNVRDDDSVARVLLDAASPLIQFYDQDGAVGKKAGLLSWNSGKFSLVQYTDAFAGVSRTPLTVDLTNGYVGILDTTPTEALTVYGDVLIQSDDPIPGEQEYDSVYTNLYLGSDNIKIQGDVFYDYGVLWEENIKLSAPYEIEMQSSQNTIDCQTLSIWNEGGINELSVFMHNLPTSDPEVAGALWCDPVDGILRVSQGS